MNPILTTPRPMVIAAARSMCRTQADTCGVDYDDLWKLYSEDFLADAEKALEAAGVPQMLAFVRSFLLATGGPTPGTLIVDRNSPLVTAAREIHEICGGAAA